MSASGIQAGAAYVRIFGDKSALVRELKGAGTDLSNWASRAAKVGGALFGVGAAGGAGLAKTTQMFAVAGSELDDMSQRTGVAGSKLSQFQYGVEQSGADLPTLETGLKKMQDGLVWPEDTKKANATLAELRVNADKFRGSTGDEQVLQMADAISRIEDPAARTAAAIDVFGKSGTQLLPFLQEGREGIEKLFAESDRLGLTMSDDDIASAAKLGDTYDRLAATAKRVGVSVGAALAPAAEEAANALANAAGSASKWISENREVVTTAGLMVGATAAAGVGVIGLSLALKAGSVVATAAAMAWTACGAAIAFLTSPIGLVVAALGVGAYAAEKTTGVFSQIGEKAKPAWETLKSDSSSAFAGIRAAMASGDLGAAAEIAWAFIKLQWVRGTSAVQAKWDQFRDLMAGAFRRLYVNAVVAASDGWEAVNTIWDDAGDYLSSVWDASTAYVLGLFDSLMVKAKQAGAAAVALYKYTRDTITGDGEGTLADYNAREQAKVQPAEKEAAARDEQRSKDYNAKQSERVAERNGRQEKAKQARERLTQRLTGDLDEQTEIDAQNRRQRLQDAEQAVKDAQESLQKRVSAAESAQRQATADSKKKGSGSGGDGEGPDGTKSDSKGEVRGTTQAGVASQLAFAIRIPGKQTVKPDDPTQSPGRANALAADNAMMSANRRPLPPGAADQLNASTYAERQDKQEQAAQRTLKIDLGDGLNVLGGKLDGVIAAIQNLEAVYG